MSRATISSTSLVEAVNFLTYPLSLMVPQSTINSLQQILLSALTAVPAWLRNSRLTLTFSSAVPPRAIFAACIATNLEWSDWFFVLGGREFDLVIEHAQVSVQVVGAPERVIVWERVPPTSPTLAPATPILGVEQKAHSLISKFNPSTKQNTIPTPIVIDPTVAHYQHKTLAQQLLQSEHEEEEADEIFAMISNFDACFISPTPTRNSFGVSKTPMVEAPASQFARLSALEEEIFHSRSAFRQSTFVQDRNTPSPVSSPESSRAGSPFSSRYSSQDSFTSSSRTSSPTSSPTKSPVKYFVPLPERRAPNSLRGPPQQAHVDKNQIQRYLYQGGQSTVLTGGVMLGGSSKISAPACAAPTSKSRTSAPGQRASQFMNKTRPQSNISSWGRGGVHSRG